MCVNCALQDGTAVLLDQAFAPKRNVQLDHIRKLDGIRVNSALQALTAARRDWRLPLVYATREGTAWQVKV